MKGKCEEKDLQLDELFQYCRWRKRQLPESVMLPAKELLRNKQAQNRENAEKKRRFWGAWIHAQTGIGPLRIAGVRAFRRNRCGEPAEGSVRTPAFPRMRRVEQNLRYGLVYDEQLQRKIRKPSEKTAIGSFCAGPSDLRCQQENGEIFS